MSSDLSLRIDYLLQRRRPILWESSRIDPARYQAPTSAMSFGEIPAKKLPPFRIVDLSPSEPFGLLHISAPQYDSTIRSYPDAVLTYLDDDDGETITVGSGVELQQRLQEPVRPGRYRLSGSALSAPRDSLDQVHLFDIQHTANSRMVWMEHEAYSSKSLRELHNNDPQSDPADDVPRRTGNPTATSQPPQTDVTYPVLPVEQTPVAQPMQHPGGSNTATAPSVRSQLPTALSAPPATGATNDQFRESFEQNVGTFADFLDSAAEVLRNVAQKTREADASPIELMLNGMKDVLSEVGQLGMEVLNGLNHEPIPARKDEPVTKAEVEATVDECEEIPVKDLEPAPCLSKRVSYADKTDVAPEEEPAAVVPQPTKKTLADRLTAMSLAESDQQSTSSPRDLLNKLQPGPSRNTKQVDLQSLLTSYSYLPKCAPTPLPAASKSQSPAYRSFPNRPGPAGPPTQKQTAPPPSIMDLETTNPDFAIRYPPLSLRRAKTVSDLNKSKQNGAESMNTKAALHRYPSIGQLEARRTPYDIHPKKRGKPPVKPMQQGEPQNASQSTWLSSPVSPIASDVNAVDKAQRQGYKGPTVEDEPIEDNIKPRCTPRGAITESGRKSTAKSLPGSWPEAKPEDMSALPISSESSGAFFNRMTGIKEPEKLPKRSVSPALSCRNTSPPADPFWPSSNLRRAKTVTASNPAARLTRPFDPLSGPPNPLFPRGNQQSAPLQDAPQPKRSLTQRERSRPQYPANNSAVDALSSWSNFPRPAQAPLMPPPFCQGAPQPLQPTPWHALPPTPQGSTIEDLPRAHSGLIPRPDMYSSGQSGMFAPVRMPTSKVDDCVRTLRQMGYGMYDVNQAARLNVYASAVAGDVMEAVDMIEEDRKVAASMNLVNGSIRTL